MNPTTLPTASDLAQLITLVAFAVAGLGFVMAGWSAWRSRR